MAAVSLLRLAESLLLKTVSTYLSFWVFITQAINYYITFIALGCNQTIRAYYLACCSTARELCILIAYNLGLKAKLPLIYFEWKQKTFNFKPWQRNIQIHTYHLEPFIYHLRKGFSWLRIKYPANKSEMPSRYVAPQRVGFSAPF